MPIQVAQALIPSTVNTPIDARTVVNGTSDIADIELPYIGMRVYCTGNGKEYRITSLKAKTIGALTVENAAVDEYEEIAEGGGGGSSSETPSGGATGGLTAAQAAKIALIYG